MPRAPASAAPLFLIHGDDDYAVKQRARQLFQQWSAELGGMDHEVIDAQVNNSGEALKALARLRESLQTLPFFGTGKAIWLQNCNFLGDERAASAQAVTETLAEVAQELKEFPWENVRLLISAGKVDKRKTFYKTLEKLGTVESYAAWSLDDKNWTYEAETAAQRAVRARKKEVSDAALAELVHSVGPDRRQLANEVEKLCLFVGERNAIDLADVSAVVTRNKQARAFALADALGERDLPRLLRTLDEELWGLRLDGQKSAIGLLYGLITKVRAMIFLKEMVREGWVTPHADYGRFKAQLDRVPPEKLPEDKRFNPLSMHPFLLHKALPHAQRYSLEELIEAMDLLLNCNQRLIFSTLDESLVLQETLIKIVKSSKLKAQSSREG
jgi:DNA polymerase-3 subunit delta